TRLIRRTANWLSWAFIVAYFTPAPSRSTPPLLLGRRPPPPGAPPHASAAPPPTVPADAPRHPRLAAAPSPATHTTAPLPGPDHAPPPGSRPSPLATAPAA